VDGQDILYIKGSYQPLRGYGLFVTGCRWRVITVLNSNVTNLHQGTTLTNRSCVHEEITNSGNSSYHVFQNLSPSHFLSKGMKVTMHRPIISSVFLYESKTRSVAWAKERKLRVFENVVLRNTFEPKTKKVIEGC